MKIQQLRFSCIWTVSLLGKMEKNVLGKSYIQRDIFKQLFNRQSSEWLLPWNDDGNDSWQHYLNRSFFWKHYLELQLDDISENDYYSVLSDKSYYGSSYHRGWTHLLPLKDKAPKIKTESTKTDIRLDNFCYPFGIGIIATVFIKPNSSLEETINNAVDARHGKHDITYEDGQSDASTLQELAQQQANHLYQKLFSSLSFAPTLNNICLPHDPFTITTIIEAKETQNEHYQNLHKYKDTDTFRYLVNGLCGFDRDWKVNQVADNFCIDDKEISHQKQAFKNLIIGTKNSRLIWFPEHFTKRAASNINKLGRYHRHLSLLSLQTEILIKVLQNYNKLKETKQQKYIARRALLLIKLLNKSSKFGVFQSWSAVKRIQLDPIPNIINRASHKLYGKGFSMDNCANSKSATVRSA